MLEVFGYLSQSVSSPVVVGVGHPAFELVHGASHAVRVTHGARPVEQIRPAEVVQVGVRGAFLEADPLVHRLDQLQDETLSNRGGNGGSVSNWMGRKNGSRQN